MSNVDKRSRVEKGYDELMDTTIEVLINWGKNLIRKKGPEIMDGVVKELKSTYNNYIMKSEHSFRKSIRKSIVEAMKKNGFSEEEIQQYLEHTEKK